MRIILSRGEFFKRPQADQQAARCVSLEQLPDPNWKRKLGRGKIPGAFACLNSGRCPGQSATGKRRFLTGSLDHQFPAFPRCPVTNIHDPGN
jgi:hypothetical protein